MEGEGEAPDRGKPNQAQTKKITIPRPGNPGHFTIYKTVEGQAQQIKITENKENEKISETPPPAEQPQPPTNAKTNDNNTPDKTNCLDNSTTGTKKFIFNAVHTQDLKQAALNYVHTKQKKTKKRKLPASNEYKLVNRLPLPSPTPFLDFTSSIAPPTKKPYIKTKTQKGPPLADAPEDTSKTEKVSKRKHHEENQSENLWVTPSTNLINMETSGVKETTVVELDEIHGNQKTQKNMAFGESQKPKTPCSTIELLDKRMMNFEKRHSCDNQMVTLTQTDNKPNSNGKNNTSLNEDCADSFFIDWITIALTNYKEECRCIKCNTLGTLRLDGKNGSKQRIHCSNCNSKYYALELQHQIETKFGDGWRELLLDIDYVRKTKTGDQKLMKTIIDGEEHQPNAREMEQEILSLKKDMIQSHHRQSNLLAKYERLYEEKEKLATELTIWKKKLTSLENQLYLQIADIKNNHTQTQQTRSVNRNEIIENQPTEDNQQPGEPTHASDQQMITMNTGPEMKTQPKRPSWKEVVAHSRPANQISNAMLTKINKMKNTLLENKCIMVKQPKVEAFYFRNIRRSPLGRLRAALRQSLPAWAILGLSFIGGSVLEVLCDCRLQHQLIATLKIAGIQNIKLFDILNDGLKREGNHQQNPLNNLRAARRRLGQCAHKARNVFAKEWYTNQEHRVRTAIYELIGEQSESESQTEDGWTEVAKKNRLKHVANVRRITTNNEYPIGITMDTNIATTRTMEEQEAIEAPEKNTIITDNQEQRRGTSHIISETKKPTDPNEMEEEDRDKEDQKIDHIMEISDKDLDHTQGLALEEQLLEQKIEEMEQAHAEESQSI